MTSLRSSSSERILTARRALWHLRHGGMKQLKAHLRRSQLGDTPALPTQAPQVAAAKSSGQKASGAIPAIRAHALPSGYTLDFLPQSFPEFHPTFPQFTVAVILDDFSYTAWSHEFTTVKITPENWRATFEKEDIDFLFVESAWAGNGKAWQYHLTGTSAPRPAVVELLDYTRQHNIPSIFWNKEDPPHFEDFLDTAKLFDTVFTSDSNMIPRYRSALGHDRVFPLGFAAQPAVHNPIRPAQGVGQRGVAFAGTYFAHKYPERREQMDVLLQGALAASRKTGQALEIFSRFIDEDEKYQFPAPFDRHVVGSLSYPKMLTAYQAYKVFLNVNSVVDSPTMCARRIFEILASGTPVVTTSSRAIPNFFSAQEITLADDVPSATLAVRALLNSSELRDRMVHTAQRRIWGEHTYAHRAVEILSKSGISSTAIQEIDLPQVSVVSSTNRPDQLQHLFEQVGRQIDPLKAHGSDLQLAVMTHGFSADEAEIQRLAQSHGIENLVILTSTPAQSLGENLNTLVSSTDGEVIAKMDDDDLYGEHYLLDALYALRFSRADLVGKQAHYLYSGPRNETILRFEHKEHRFTDFVMGPTLVGYREIFEQFPFSHLSRGEDSDFLCQLARAGKKIYSTDRFNFVQMRSGADHRHSWTVSDAELLASGRVQYAGLNTQHMMF